MRTHLFVVVFLIAFSAAARAQDPPTLPESTDQIELARRAMNGKLYGTLDFGARISQVDGDEARFQRYRDLRSGVYITDALGGRRTEDWSIEAQGWNIGYRDQKYLVDVQRVGRLTASFLWDQIPLFISQDTRMLYSVSAPGVLRLEDLMQQQIQTLVRDLHDYEDQAVQFDLRTLRRIGQADMVLNVDRESDFSLTIRNTTRDGAIPYGGTFGFSNAVEIPVPVDTRTTDFRTAYEWSDDTWLARVGWDGSAFENAVESATWDNPLRFGPDISGGPSQGRMALWPDNTLNYLHGTGAVSLPMRGRLTGYLALGTGRSNETLLPFTNNTGLPTIALARETAEAKQQMTIAQVNAAMRPAPRVALTAKYRFADMDVQTPVFDRTTGQVRYDTSIATPASPSQYHSVRRNTFDADGAFDVAPSTSVKVGYSHLGSEYTHRIWETTSENVFRVSLDSTGNALFGVRALYENRARSGDNFQDEALAEVGELPTMRHYDVADRDRNRFTLIANLTPEQPFALTASIGIGRDEYPDSGHGLESYDSNQYSIGFSATPADRYNFSATYGWERYSSLQRSRNAGSDADLANPARDWTTDFTGKVDYFEASFDIDGVIERTFIRLTADWNKSNDTYLYGLVSGSPLAVPEPLPPVVNELFRTEVDVTYELARNLQLGLAYWFDDYNVEDFALGPTTLSGIALPPIEPGEPEVATNALLLGYLYRPYTAHVGFVRLTYKW